MSHQEQLVAKEKSLDCQNASFALHFVCHVISPRVPGLPRLHVNSNYFSTTAKRVTSLTWGSPPSCN